MTIMSETIHVHVFKFNTDLKKNTNKMKDSSSDIEKYPGAGPLPEASVAPLPAGGISSVLMIFLDWPCPK
ncbi:hypothetical protein KFY46_26395, partial [Salmonella enterica subsp. enterica serovar 1,4,[5],12:i:-]|nr:hypothetical protein [Salmonella enterica subsp. enterica serovar 1,4,[5],12:i:-]